MTHDLPVKDGDVSGRKLLSYRTIFFPGDIAMIIFPSETQNLKHVFF